MPCFAMRHMDAIDKGAKKRLRPVAIADRPTFNERYSVCTGEAPPRDVSGE